MSTQQNEKGLMVLDGAKEQFALAMKEAQSLDIVNNVAGAFETALVVNKLEAVLTDDVMKAVLMPLMNKKIGFLTDRDPNKPNKNGMKPSPYPIDTVRTAIIDAAAIGLLPTGNQFNIIAGSMYPAKAGFTALLSELKELKATKKELETEIDEMTDKVKAMFTDEEAMIDMDGKVLATYKTSAGRKTVDSNKLHSDYPEIYEEVLKQSAGSRTLLIK